MVGHKYTAEEKEFLYSFVPGHSYHEILDAYNKRFEEHITISQLKCFISNHKLNTGRTGRFEKGHIPVNKGKHTPSVGRMVETQFKKGHLPHNTKPIGYERLTKDGYIEVKVREHPDKENRIWSCFELKHRYIWEQTHGPIPKGHKIIFLDGDKRNFAIENLSLISNAENLEMLRQGLRSSNSELTKTGILIAKVSVTVNNAKRKEKGEKENA